MPYKVHIKKTNVKIHGNPVVSATYSGKDFSLDKIKEIVEPQFEELRESGHQGEISINVLMSGKNGKPGRWTYITPFVDVQTENLDISDGEVWEDYFGKRNIELLPKSFKSFQVLLTKSNTDEGGISSNNDCLYDCLYLTMPNLIKNAFPSPAHLKVWCRLNRNDLIPIKMIPRIEERIDDYKINIVGEHSYTSLKEARNTITLRLHNNHYTVVLGRSITIYGNICEQICLIRQYENIFI